MYFDSSLNGYARELDRALKRTEEFANFNKDIQHASIVVCTAFRHAKAKIRLLSHELDPVLYASPWFETEVKAFLDRGGKLEILLESKVSEQDHPLMKMAAHEPDKIDVRQVSDEFQRRTQYPFNFMVVDDIGYRFEHDRTEPAAVFAFHSDNEIHIENTKRLVEWFDTVFERSDKALPA